MSNVANFMRNHTHRTWHLCYSVQIAITKYQDQRAYKQQEFLSHNPGDWKSKVRQSTIMVSLWWEPSSVFQNANFLLCPHVMEKSSLRPCTRVLIPLMTQARPKGPSSLALGFNSINLGRREEDTNLSPQQHSTQFSLFTKVTTEGWSRELALWNLWNPDSQSFWQN